MAAKKLTPVKCPVNKVTEVTLEAEASTSEGCEFTLPAADEDIVILAVDTGSAGGTVTLKKPEKGHYAATSADESKVIGAGKAAVIRFESARFANTDNTIKVVTSATALKLAVIC